MSEYEEAQREAAFLIVLAQRGIPTDVQDLLVRGDGRGTIAPGALRAAISKLDEMRGGGLAREAAFLIDRLTDFENDGEARTDKGEGDWHGHVSPSISRLRGYLPPPPEQSE